MKKITKVGLAFSFASLVIHGLSACGSSSVKDVSSPEANSSAATLQTDISGAKVLWNGDVSAQDPSWQPGSWTAVSNQDLDNLEVAISNEQGYQDSASIKAEVNGKGWMGFGWNWMGNWEQAEGMDISEYQSIAFMIKISGQKPIKKGGISVHLNSGGDQKANMSQSFPVGQFTPHNYKDGGWHQIVVPLSIFKRTSMQGGNSGSFNIDKAKEIDFSVNAQAYVDFDMYVDDIVLLN